MFEFFKSSKGNESGKSGMKMAFENAEGGNRPQSKPNYKKTMKDMHVHMFLL